MALIPFSCTPLEIPDPPPMLDIPHFGVMQKAWNSLHSIPKPSDLLMAFQDQLALALAPVRRFLELVEILMAFKQCTTAVIDAIDQLSPKPIYECLKGLQKAIAKIASWVPPMCYVRLGMELASYCIDLIDEIVLFFVEIDNLITEYLETLNLANLLGDTDLIRITNCAMTDIRVRLTIVVDLLKFIQPINDVLMDMFTRLLPGGETVKKLKKQADTYQAMGSYFGSVTASLRAGGSTLSLPSLPGFTPPAKTQNPLCPIPVMSPLLEAMNQARTALVMVYNVLAPFVGAESSKEPRTMPELQNF